MRQVAITLHDCVKRRPDLLARYGGDEFVALLPNAKTADCRIVAERMADAVRALETSIDSGTANAGVTISAGVASLIPDKDQTDPEVLLRHADEALYAARSSGRNTLKF